MRNANGDIFKTACDAICITTNGFVKRDGSAVMGRGCAKAAATRRPELPRLLGQAIRTRGNVVSLLLEGTPALYSFPVKFASAKYTAATPVVAHMSAKFKLGDTVPGWALCADATLIERSAYQLVAIADKEGYSTVVLPRPGCGAGELSWAEVEPLLSTILDDRFICMTF